LSLSRQTTSVNSVLIATGAFRLLQLMLRFLKRKMDYKEGTYG